MTRWDIDSAPSDACVEWSIGAADDPHREHGSCSLASWLDSNKDGVSLLDVRTLLTRGDISGGGGAACEWRTRMLPPSFHPCRECGEAHEGAGLDRCARCAHDAPPYAGKAPGRVERGS